VRDDLGLVVAVVVTGLIPLALVGLPFNEPGRPLALDGLPLPFPFVPDEPGRPLAEDGLPFVPDEPGLALDVLELPDPGRPPESGISAVRPSRWTFRCAAVYGIEADTSRAAPPAPPP
jgi:hypothetical protein